MSNPPPPPPQWGQPGSCVGLDDATLDHYFFAEKGTPDYLLRTAYAKRVCERCPVLAQCRAWALGAIPNPLPFGVAGGMSEGTRMEVRERLLRLDRSRWRPGGVAA